MKGFGVILENCNSGLDNSLFGVLKLSQVERATIKLSWMYFMFGKIETNGWVYLNCPRSATPNNQGFKKKKITAKSRGLVKYG